MRRGFVTLAAVLHTGVISRPMGASLVLVYAVVVALVWWKEREPPTFGEAAELKKDETSSPSDVPRRETLALVLLIAGIAAMVLGGWLAVGGAERIVTAPLDQTSGTLWVASYKNTIKRIDLANTKRADRGLQARAERHRAVRTSRGFRRKAARLT